MEKNKPLLLSSFLLFFVFGLLPLLFSSIALWAINDRTKNKVRERTHIFHEKLLNSIKSKDDDALLIAKFIRKTFFLIDARHPNFQQRILKRLKRKFPGTFEVYFFDSKGVLRSDLSSTNYPKAFLEKCFTLIKYAANGKLPSANQNPFLRNLLKGRFAGDLIHRHGKPMPLGTKDYEGFFIFDFTKNASSTLGGYFGFLHPGRFPKDIAIKYYITSANKKLGRSGKIYSVQFNNLGLQFFPTISKNEELLKKMVFSTLQKFSPYSYQGSTIISILPRFRHGYLIAVSEIHGFFSILQIVFLLILGSTWLLFSVKAFLLSDWSSSTPIRSRVILFFLFASGFPISTLLVFAYVSIEDRILVLEQNIEKEIRDKIRQFDERFPGEIARLEDKIRNIKNEFMRRHNDPDRFKAFEALRDEPINNIFLVTPKGECLYTWMEDTNQVQRDRRKFAIVMAREILKTLNREEKIDVGTFIAETAQELIRSMTGSYSTVEDYVKNLGKFQEFQFANENSLLVLDAVYSPSGSADYLLIVFLRRTELELKFFIRHMEMLQGHGTNTLRFTLINQYLEREDFCPFPEDRPNAKKLVQITNKNKSQARMIIGEGKNRRLWISAATNNIQTFSIIINTSLAPLQDEIERLRKLLVKLSLFFLSVTGFIGFLLSRQLLRPIREINKGITLIRQRNFDEQIEVLSNDELGQMSKLLNQVILEMDDLAVARVIQEHLLPQEILTLGEYEIYGKCRPMTDVGGDYFDFQVRNETNIFGIIGDVSGHGVSAALVMGIAKCFFAQDFADKLPLPDLLKEFNNFLIKHVKKVKMMTIFIFKIDTIKHKLLASNAGHNFPFFRKGKTGEVTELEIVGFPVGKLRTVKYDQKEIEFEPGDSLFLFTDGLTEARNQAKEEVSMKRAKKWFAESDDSTVVGVIDTMFKRYEEFKGQQQEAEDDVTMIFLRRKKN